MKLFKANRGARSLNWPGSGFSDLSTFYRAYRKQFRQALGLTRKMYPKLSFHLQQIIADVLQDAEPIEEQPKKNTRDKIIKGVQDSYSKSGELVDAKATVSNAQDKAEELKDKILESLKLND
jgi:hypothetical protein